MPRTLDALVKHDELRALLGAGDPQRLYEAARRAQVALEFRGTDAMLGLTPVNDEVLARLTAAIRAALAEAAAHGLHDAACDLARMHVGDGDPAAALAVLGPAARAGHASAATLAARIAWRSGQTQRYAEALAWLEGAREPDDDGGVRFMLALFAFHGVGQDPDVARAADLQEEAAARGNADAMFELYVMTSQGVGRPADEAVALAWCRRAAEAGNLRAMGNLGGFFATGQGVARDPEQALAWYERAAQAGHGRSAATLGVMYATGDCVPRDPVQARSWFVAADGLGFDWRDMAEAVDLDPAEWE